MEFYLEHFPSIIDVLCTITVTLVAFFGISEWKKEHIGRKRIDLAEEVLLLFYQAEEEIKSIRSILSYENEGSTRKQRGNETKEETDTLNAAFILKERYYKKHELFKRMYALRHRFMIYNGNDSIKPFEDIKNVVIEMLVSSELLGKYQIRIQNPRLTREQIAVLHEKIEKETAIFWAGYGEVDEIDNRVKQAVSVMDKACSRIIKKGG